MSLEASLGLLHPWVAQACSPFNPPLPSISLPFCYSAQSQPFSGMWHIPWEIIFPLQWLKATVDI